MKKPFLLFLGSLLVSVLPTEGAIDERNPGTLSGDSFSHSEARALQQTGGDSCATFLGNVATTSPQLTCTCKLLSPGGHSTRCSLPQRCGSYSDVGLSAFGLSCPGEFCLNFALVTDFDSAGTKTKIEAIYDITGSTDYSQVSLVSQFPESKSPSFSAFVTLGSDKYKCRSYNQCSDTKLDLFDCSNIQTGVVIQTGCPGGGFFFQKFSLCPSGGAMKPTTNPITATVNPVPFCFSGESVVQVQGRGPVKMKDLVLGDSVKVGNGNYEAIYSFGHKNEAQVAQYLQIYTNTEKSRPLTLSKDHMVFVNDERTTVPASWLKVGDLLLTLEGVVAVKSIRRVTAKGVYAPFTASGSILVDGLVVSTYISYQDSSHLKVGGVTTSISYQWMGHTFKSGHRLAYKAGILRGETYTEDGISHWVDSAHTFGQRLLEQHAVIVIAILIPAIFAFSLLSVIDAAPVEVLRSLILCAAVVLILARHRRKSNKST